MDIEAIIERSAELHPWRDRATTTWLALNMDLPFCFECADWHATDDDHSSTE